MQSVQRSKFVLHLFLVIAHYFTSGRIQEIYGFTPRVITKGTPNLVTEKERTVLRSRASATLASPFFFATEVTPVESPTTPTTTNNNNNSNAMNNIRWDNGVPVENTIIQVEKIDEDVNNTAKSTEELWLEAEALTIQGNSLKTCSFHEDVDRVEVVLRTLGRPLSADVEMWQGPDNSPQKISIYLEDGGMRNFRAMMESPGDSNSVAVRNTGSYQFPLIAGVVAVDDCESTYDPTYIEAGLGGQTQMRTVQGGAVYTMPFKRSVESVKVVLMTDGRPLNARVELLQGPNNDKQIMDIFAEDGEQRPFYAVIETPGAGNVVRIVNTSTVEFPLYAFIEPVKIEEKWENSQTYFH